MGTSNYSPLGWFNFTHFYPLRKPEIELYSQASHQIAFRREKILAETCLLWLQKSEIIPCFKLHRQWRGEQGFMMWVTFSDFFVCILYQRAPYVDRWTADTFSHNLQETYGLEVQGLEKFIKLVMRLALPLNPLPPSSLLPHTPNGQLSTEVQGVSFVSYFLIRILWRMPSSSVRQCALGCFFFCFSFKYKQVSVRWTLCKDSHKNPPIL